MTRDELGSPNEMTSFIALLSEAPVGFCTFKLKEEFRPDLGPWLADLVVDRKYQKQGVGKMLVDKVILKAKEVGYEKLYLFALDASIPKYYELLGWEKICMDKFESRPVTIMGKVLLLENYKNQGEHIQRN